MSPVNAPNEPAKVPTPQVTLTAQQQRIDHLFRHVAQDPGAQYLKTLVENLHNGATT
jgi:hypothetical protein